MTTSSSTWTRWTPATTPEPSYRSDTIIVVCGYLISTVMLQIKMRQVDTQIQLMTEDFKQGKVSKEKLRLVLTTKQELMPQLTQAQANGS